MNFKNYLLALSLIASACFATDPEITIRPYNQKTDEQAIRTLIKSGIEQHYLNGDLDDNIFEFNKGISCDALAYLYIAYCNDVAYSIIVCDKRQETDETLMGRFFSIPHAPEKQIMTQLVPYLFAQHKVKCLAWVPISDAQEEILKQLNFQDQKCPYYKLYALAPDKDNFYEF